MKKLFLLVSAWFLFVQCAPEKEDPFLISKDRVGKLMKNQVVADIEQVYMADSVVRDTTSMNMGRNNKIEVYEKGGKLLLTLTPVTDSIVRVENVRIHDPRYRTEAGISLESTFGDIKQAYEIRKVVSSMNNILILLKDHPMYVTISREDLPAALRYSSSSVDVVQIPDDARIKYLMVGWE